MMKMKMRKFYHPGKTNPQKLMVKMKSTGKKITNQANTQTTLTTSTRSWLSTQNLKPLTAEWVLLLQWASLFQQAKLIKSSHFLTRELKKKIVQNITILIIFGSKVSELSGPTGEPTLHFGLHITCTCQATVLLKKPRHGAQSQVLV